jgi:hypothetical protein
MEINESQKGEDKKGIFQNMSPWDRVTWPLSIVYIIIVLIVFWLLGWQTLGFPL